MANPKSRRQYQGRHFTAAFQFLNDEDSEKNIRKPSQVLVEIRPFSPDAPRDELEEDFSTLLGKARDLSEQAKSWHLEGMIHALAFFPATAERREEVLSGCDQGIERIESLQRRRKTTPSDLHDLKLLRAQRTWIKSHDRRRSAIDIRDALKREFGQTVSEHRVRRILAAARKRPETLS